jgi:hypothetical protein
MTTFFALKRRSTMIGKSGDGVLGLAVESTPSDDNLRFLHYLTKAFLRINVSDFLQTLLGVNYRFFSTLEKFVFVGFSGFSRIFPMTSSTFS